MSRCACGRSPDPGVRPGGGCYCSDLPACKHGAIYPDSCDQCVKIDHDRFKEALVAIRERCGAVCPEYEICTHETCASSYTAWALADEALNSAESGQAER